MPSFDLIAFDLDGTVFATPFKPEVSRRVRAAFEAAHEVGVAIAVSSGRPFWMLGAQLQRAPWLDWGILLNGSRVQCLRGDDPGLSLALPRTEALALIETLSSFGGALTLHTGTASYIEQRKAEYYAESQRAQAADARIPRGVDDEASEPRALNPIDAVAQLGKMDIVASALDTMRADPTLELFKLDCTLPDVASCEAAAAALEKMGGFESALLGPTELEAARAGVSKGDGLGWLCEHLGIDEDRAVAFGDSGNDLSMTGRAATFVAMGNATDEVKAVADDECETVQRDGVARWIEAHL